LTLETDWSEVVQISTEELVILMESKNIEFVGDKEENTTSDADP